MHSLKALTCLHAAAVVQMCTAPAAVLCSQISRPAALANLLPAAYNSPIIVYHCTFISLHVMQHL